MARGTMKCFHSQALPTLLQDESSLPLWKGKISCDMLLDENIVTSAEIIDCQPLPSEVIRSAHSRAYLHKILSGQMDLKEQLLLGFKVTPAVYPLVSSSVNASISTCLTALAEKVAVSLSGGMHNAYEDFGLNYSIFNDVAISAKILRQMYPQIKILIIDTDADHGAGTNSLLKDDPLTKTFSFHSYGSRKPSFMSDYDVTVARYIEGNSYIDLLMDRLATALERSMPDLVIWVSGVSGHYLDQSRLMRLNSEDLFYRDILISRAMIKNKIPLAVLLGGGNNENSVLTGKLHRNTIAAVKHNARAYASG